MRQISRIGRRRLLGSAAAATGFAAAGLLPSGGFAQGKTQTVNLQLGWLAGNNQVGEVAAKYLGYYEEEKLNLVIQPGGPSIDGVAIVASGRHEIGQVSSSPSLMLAASQKIPVTCFATGLQRHPYAYFSLPKKPVRVPRDLIGKKVGVQATARILLNALMKKHGIAEKDVEVVIIGSEMTPILTGQTDVVSGWITNTTTLKPLGPDRIDLSLWDAGVRLYALPYYATKDTIEKKADMLAAYVRATSRGWEYTLKNPEKAVDFLVKDYPNLKRDDEIEGTKVLLTFAFNANTRANGWGAFDPEIWQEQINLYNELKQFSAGAPKLEDVITTKILDATKAQRAKIG
ncbi:NitT/TauT family transport system substrate-binding protein [Enhydrobacter aerosaccus]|uniref:Thiamine pyrimidine synthase n=1 Tax=Enhydrobacter aerosaccus TaxID=225324 RepID=A0A1T4MQD9_9HYPH|nr:ABC transporter substrate-binding protein [Enhydrobacter aerosaccus]SJZ68948.1 NitT/TauT family transport system substrate-binding protein [Enhydrobacter aerosaccus]